MEEEKEENDCTTRVWELKLKKVILVAQSKRNVEIAMQQ